MNRKVNTPQEGIMTTTITQFGLDIGAAVAAGALVLALERVTSTRTRRQNRKAAQGQPITGHRSVTSQHGNRNIAISQQGEGNTATLDHSTHTTTVNNLPSRGGSSASTSADDTIGAMIATAIAASGIVFLFVLTQDALRLALVALCGFTAAAGLAAMHRGHLARKSAGWRVRLLLLWIPAVLTGAAVWLRWTGLGSARDPRFEALDSKVEAMRPPSHAPWPEQVGIVLSGGVNLLTESPELFWVGIAMFMSVALTVITLLLVLGQAWRAFSSAQLELTASPSTGLRKRATVYDDTSIGSFSALLTVVVIFCAIAWFAPTQEVLTLLENLQYSRA
jgi:hypothetical protein